MSNQPKTKSPRRPFFSITGINVQGNVVESTWIVLLVLVILLLILMRRQLDFNRDMVQALMKKND